MPRTNVVVRKPSVGAPSAVVPVSGVAAAVSAGATAAIASSRRVPVGVVGTMAAGNLLPPVPRDFYLSAPASLSAAEGTNAQVTVTSSIAFATNTQIDYTVTGINGAQAGVDFVAPASPLILLAGQLSATLTIQILSDAVVDPNEVVRISWTAVTAL